ncbi:MULTISPECIES: helix-turn-helix transcriptional regulator [Ramlibacter]|nr:helix-turn-helix transcriptional regulator [Ramlibacter rhizophilus]
MDSTISALYEAVSHDEQWPAALAGISRAFDSPRVAILRTTANLDGVFEIRALNHDPEAQKLYRDYYWAIDPTLRVTRTAHPGAWFDCESVVDPATTPEPEYMDFAVRHGIRYVAGGKVHVDKVSCTALSLQRPADHRRFDHSAGSTFRRLATHIGRASALSSDLRQAELAKGLSIAALDALQWPVFAVSSTGKLLLANQKGEAQLKLGTPFELHAGSLRSRDPEMDLVLRRVLSAAATRTGTSIKVKAGRSQWWLRAVPITMYSGVTLLYLSRIDGQRPSPDLMQELLNLSPAQADVACLLMDGHSVKQIASARAVSVWTVRAQLREIMHKAGVRRQVDLTQMLLSLPAISMGATNQEQAQ